MKALQLFRMPHFPAAAWIIFVAALTQTPSARAQHYKVLYSFAGGSDGFSPVAGLIHDQAGNFYGTTLYGGIPPRAGQGTVFKLDKRGTEIVLHVFTGQADGDGASPWAGLVRDADGNLYGTTAFGGDRICDCGTVFKVDANGNETLLHSFGGFPLGSYPFGGLVRDAAGNLYGTTQSGGAFTYGTVFKLDANGNEIVLHSFNLVDGAEPSGELIRDSAGNIYGTTLYGGAHGAGTVFKLDPTGTETVLYSFRGGSHGDGSQPTGGLVRDADGNLYGTTKWGGDLSCESFGCGTVFKVDRSGRETVLHSFTGGSDGEQPWAGLARDAAGNLYGTTQAGGGTGCPAGIGCGTIFKVNANGTETILYRFGPRGESPVAPLIRDGRGNLYGTTTAGGATDHGTVFKLTPP